jgi:hypothetical protein
MARQLKHKHKSAPRFAGRIEHLEDRRVMAADMPLELMGASDSWVGDAPPLEQQVVAPPLEQHGLGDADFWIDPATQVGFDEYLQGVEKFLAEAHNLTGWFNVKNNYGFTGLGQTVAVIDSGIAYDHFALGGGFGSNYRVVGGWDFTEENDANPYDDGPSGGHGTHVSGIIGSTDATRTGVAPGVDLVGLRVFNDAGQGFFSWMENALRWIHTNRNAFENPITAVNMSVGVSSWNSASIPSWTTLEDEFAQLKADGIFISVSAGNSFTSFNAPGLSYPASSPNVVPVMATDDAGNMSYFSQRLGRAIAAPGQNIVSTVPDYAGNNNGSADDFAAMGGTSMAAPYVAGASVLIRQAMQFVGMTNINQDTIYNHMMATADSFYDSVTAQTYKRLNLWRAIDTLMPADDFGSTTADAYNLGTLSAPAAINGKIAKLTDVDCFRFTAATSGAVTFSATCSSGMAPTWQVWNATALPSAAGTVSFNVVAGQSYTVGLSSSCLGSYTLASTMSTPFTFTDWGSIASSTVNNIAVSGEKWFRVTATRTGILTAIGAFNPAGGNVSIGFYNTNQQLLTAGATNGGEARVDMNAAAGTSYYVRVSGTNSDVDFKLANLVTQSGSSVAVGGTAGNDRFIMAAGSFHWISINDVSYGFALAGVNQIAFDGGAGTDSFSFYGSAGAETVNLRSGSATISGSSLNLTASNVENEYAYSGGGADVANLYDTAGNDSLVALPTKATFTLSTGYVLEANGFAKVKAWATTGTDTASFTDSAGVDAYIAGAVRGILTGAGYWNEAEGFDQTIAYATTGGVDRVEYYDSSGNDVFTGWSNRATIVGTGFSHDARGFESTVTYAMFGGYDQATLYDSTGNDALTAWSNRVTFVGTGFAHDAQGFDKVIAYSTAGGVDAATFYDTPGNDNYIAGQLRGILTGAGYWNQADGFDSTVAYSSAGGNDWVDYYDSSGDDLYTAWWNRATFTGAGFSHDARGFKKTKAWSLLGGNDRAVLYDSAGNDTLHAGNVRAILLGSSFWNEAEGFARTEARATAGGYDRVELWGSVGVDSLVGLAAAATYSGTGYRHDLDGFDAILGRGLLGNDSINLGATDWVFSQVGA